MTLPKLNVLHWILAVVLAGLLVWLLLFAIIGVRAAPGRTPAEHRAQDMVDIRAAARREAVAFLSVDYKHMGPATDRVLDGATGPFERQYRASLKFLKKSAAQQNSIARGYVKEVGIGTVDDDSATVFVAAGSKVRNDATKNKVQDRAWRMKLTMAKKDGRWLVSGMEFVG